MKLRFVMDPEPQHIAALLVRTTQDAWPRPKCYSSPLADDILVTGYLERRERQMSKKPDDGSADGIALIVFVWAMLILALTGATWLIYTLTV